MYFQDTAPPLADMPTTATSKRSMARSSQNLLPQNTGLHSLDPQTTSRRWSSQMRIWSASGSACSTRVRRSSGARTSGRRGKGRSLASKCRWRSCRSASAARRTWRSGSRGSSAVRNSYHPSATHSHTSILLCRAQGYPRQCQGRRRWVRCCCGRRHFRSPLKTREGRRPCRKEDSSAGAGPKVRVRRTQEVVEAKHKIIHR